MMTQSPPWLPLAVLAGLGVMAVSARADFSDTVLSLNPTHYWRLNEKATVPGGDRAANLGSLGAGANGFYVGAASHPVDGALASGNDTAASFDATAGTAVSIPYSTALNPAAAFSVEAWLNPGADTTLAAPTCALSSGQFASPRSGWLIYQVDTGWSFRLYAQNGTATSADVTAGTAPQVGTWYHLVATFDGTKARLYVDGKEVGSADAAAYVPSAGGPMFIGGRADSSFW